MHVEGINQKAWIAYVALGPPTESNTNTVRKASIVRFAISLMLSNSALDSSLFKIILEAIHFY